MDKILYRVARRVAVFVLLGLGACGTNVVAGGRLGQLEDPNTGEAWYVLEGLESGGIELRALGFGEHDGALIDLWASHEDMPWQACQRAYVGLGGDDVLELFIVRNDFEAERGILNNLIYVERVSFIFDDPELELVAAAPHIDISVCGHEAVLGAAARQSLQRFARTVLDAHGGQRFVPLVIPSE